MQFKEIPGPAYVSADVPGRGIRPRNAFALKNGIGAIPNIGPISGATAYGKPCSSPPTCTNTMHRRALMHDQHKPCRYEAVVCMISPLGSYMFYACAAWLGAPYLVR